MGEAGREGGSEPRGTTGAGEGGVARRAAAGCIASRRAIRGSRESVGAFRLARVPPPSARPRRRFPEARHPVVLTPPPVPASATLPARLRKGSARASGGLERRRRSTKLKNRNAGATQESGRENRRPRGALAPRPQPSSARPPPPPALSTLPTAISPPRRFLSPPPTPLPPVRPRRPRARWAARSGLEQPVSIQFDLRRRLARNPRGGRGVSEGLGVRRRAARRAPCPSLRRARARAHARSRVTSRASKVRAARRSPTKAISRRCEPWRSRFRLALGPRNAGEAGRRVPCAGRRARLPERPAAASSPRGRTRSASGAQTRGEGAAARAAGPAIDASGPGALAAARAPAGSAAGPRGSARSRPPRGRERGCASLRARPDRRL